MRSVVVLLSLSVACLLAGRTLFHFLQLESYQFAGYFKTLRRRLLKAILPGIILTLVWVGCAAALAQWGTGMAPWAQSLLEAAVLLIAGWVIRLATRERKEKKPLKYTPRMIRLLGVSGIVFFLLVLFFSQIGSRVDPATGEIVRNPLFALCVIFPVLLPLWVALAAAIVWPVEKGIQWLYAREAKAILKSRPDLIRIGITGSWGKTSVKMILGTLLEEKYHTLVTPGSVNTPMGITRIVRTKLEPGHRVLIAEMGARHPRDIRELCHLVKPEYGVLTSVGPQHLDTFKTVDRVKRTKYDLIASLPRTGAAFFADDDGICVELYEQTRKEKSLAGLNPERDDVWAENVETTPEGSRFLLCTREARIPCETVLLGELNIRNIVLAASVALRLGVSEKQIARGIEKLCPVEHRLQLIPGLGGPNVIDDAFNSNIQGAEQALRVLAAFPGKRIVVTPGMVELGDQEAELNHRLGMAMADSCDEAVIVGQRHGEPIVQGLLEAGMLEDRIHTVSSLEEARAWVSGYASAGDTILYENDLPDNYSE